MWKWVSIVKASLSPVSNFIFYRWRQIKNNCRKIFRYEFELSLREFFAKFWNQSLKLLRMVLGLFFISSFRFSYWFLGQLFQSWILERERFSLAFWCTLSSAWDGEPELFKISCEFNLGIRKFVAPLNLSGKNSAPRFRRELLYRQNTRIPLHVMRLFFPDVWSRSQISLLSWFISTATPNWSSLVIFLYHPSTSNTSLSPSYSSVNNAPSWCFVPCPLHLLLMDEAKIPCFNSSMDVR